MFFSIVIPIYNAEKYLKRCIESIMEQSFTSYEIILIDDGSTDSCKAIEEMYSKEFPNIKVISSHHIGASAARNLGIENADGEYIVFCDSDDSVESKMLEHIHNVLENSNADICYANQHYVVNGKSKTLNVVFDDKEKRQSFSRTEFMEMISQEGNFIPGSMWLFAVKRQYLIDKEIRLDKDIIWSEDEDFSLNICTNAERIAVAYYAGYDYYVNNECSVSEKITIEALGSRLDVYNKWYEYFKSNQVQHAIAKKILREYCNYLKQVGTFDDKEIDRYLKERLKSERHVWIEDNNSDVLIYKMFGLNIGILYNRLYKLLYSCYLQLRKWKRNVQIFNSGANL